MADSSVGIKQSKSASFKAHCHTEKGRREINAFLNGLLKVKDSFDEQKKSWCWWLLAGGKTVEEFKNTVKSYDQPTICGLVWNKNFVAYRCRDCGISPCMSICADCFHAGNHEGHDFNMFKSQAGGACDCGDESVMAREGFCSRHGKEVDETTKRNPPDELFDMVRIMIPHLCMRLYTQLDQADNEALGSSSDVMSDANELAEFVINICETDTMKNVVAECLLMKKSDMEASTKDRHLMTSNQSTSSRASSSTKRVNILTRTSDLIEKEESFDMECESSESQDDEDPTFLDCMMDFVTKLEFPQKIVTFLLHLLPCKQYKESFTRVFCQNYQKIAKILVSTSDTGPNVEQLASRVVHVSVQLYSNKHLAEKMVKEQNFLYVMVRVLHDMIKPALKPFKRGQSSSSQLVVNCDNRALKDHCYWPIVTDFINVLSHKTIAETFMNDHDLVKQWIQFIQYLTGMNISQRQLITHIEFEPTVYCTSFSVELEAASSPLWSMINACTILNSEGCLKNMIQSIVAALESWYHHGSTLMPKRDEVTFHLPLHRYLSGFLSLAMSHFNLVVNIPHKLMSHMTQHLLQIQAAVCEINAGRWVRNGNQIRSQVRLYVECHFCNSMVDLDIFLLQLCAANLDPDDFLTTILERFGIKHWFEFGDLAVPTPSCFDSDTDIHMVKGALILILTLLNSRLYLGQSNQDVVRQEMVTQLCIGDKTHSQLVELIPDKPGQSHKIQDFEDTLNELADYKAPSFESGSMQQGKYAPKDKVWESEFDPIHVFHRVVQRQDIQSAMNRYSAYVNKSNQSSNTIWPPFKPLKPLPQSFQGILRLLNCKTMHGMLFCIFYKATLDSSDAVLYLAVHLASLALENNITLPQPPPIVVPSKEEEDIGCQIATKCIDHLEIYGKHVKGLHQTEDLKHINADLVCKLKKDPSATIDPQHFSCHEVCVVMACALHQIMQPPLFDPFLPFMARVLNSALTNRSNTHEKVAQLQYIQFLLELLPQHRQRLVRKLTRHLLSVSERYKIPTKNLVLVSDDSQPMELSMLLMYLIKYHDWLFRVRTPSPGWPRTISDLDFPSVSMVTNIRHTIGIVTDQSAPMDTSDKEIGPSSSQTSLKTSAGRSSDESTDFQSLVQEFMAITEASESVARSLLYTCQGNLEVAINIHLNMEDTIPDVIPCPDSTQSTSTTREEEMTSTSSSDQPKALNESILSLLLKIKTGLQSSSSSANTPTSFGSGIYYINKLLELASKHSVENSSILSVIDSPGTDPSSSSPSENTDDPTVKASLRRQRARERQQKLLAEFASKQKSFMEQTLKKDPDALDRSMAVDGCPTVVDIPVMSYECVICGESSPSTEEHPVGLVALLQPTAVLKHRSIKPHHSVSGSDTVHDIHCGNLVQSRINAFSKHFSPDDSLDALAAGCNGGIHVQTCGHYLHVDCQQSYLRSLQEEEAAQLHQMHSFNPRNGDFTCPLCRQLGNCVLPEIPSRISSTREIPRTFDYAEWLSQHEDVLKKYNQNWMTKLTKSALNFSVLGASIKTVTQIAAMLDSLSEEMKTEKHFSLICRTLRTNLELEYVDKTARKLSTSRKSCFGSMFRAFQFHCQTIVAPMISVWSELTNIEIPQTASSTQNRVLSIPVLLRDGPSLLLQMMLSWPTALSLHDFQCFVQVVYNLVFTQALVHSCCRFVGDERLSWQETGKKATAQEKSQKSLSIELLLGFVTHALSSSNLFKKDKQLLGISQSVWSPHMVEQSIRDFCLPYLKLASLISSLCFDTVLPTVESCDQEFQTYTASLGMSPEPGSAREVFSCADCLSWQHNEKPLSIMRKWCESLSSFTRRYDIFDKSEDLIPVTYQWPSPSLLALPERYDTLIQQYRKQTCATCNTKPVDPAICLVCGKFVCLQGTCCMTTHDDVRRYECVQHAGECGAGTGVFLIILSSVTIIIRADRVCIWGSVYLDSFGEEDRDLRRGKPLFLSQERFKRLEEQWFTHSFDHTCKRWKRHLNTL